MYKICERIKEKAMKLIFCPKCQDVRKLGYNMVTCTCGESWGKYYEDGLNAVIGGEAVAIGFSNIDFLHALKSQPKTGTKGKKFEAFVIPRYCDTIDRDCPKMEKPQMKVWQIHLWGYVLMVLARTHEEVVDWVIENKWAVNVGPMDIGDRVWDPLTQRIDKPVTILCAGESGFAVERKMQEQRQAEENVGAGI
jgi:hypothetical protein